MENQRRKLWTITITLFVSYGGVDSQCYSPPEPLDAVAEVRLEDFRAYTCTNGLVWSSGVEIEVSQCRDEKWSPISSSCEDSVPSSCQSEPFNISDDAVLAFEGKSSRLYECTAPKHWLSGISLQITLCQNESWTEIWDICEEVCYLPRDCSDVAKLGISENGYYYTISSGTPQGKISKIWCTFHDKDAWTYIFTNNVTETIKSWADFQDGYSESRSYNDLHQYFAGLDFLYSLTLPTSEKPKSPVVLETLFRDGNRDVIFHATYGNFSVGPPPGYPLLSLGDYHGNAGDGFRSLLNTEFQYEDNSGPFWWGVNAKNVDEMQKLNTNWLTKSSKNWYPLLNDDRSKVVSVEMRIRSVEEDSMLSCPPLIGADPSWNKTTISVPFGRQPDTLITWNCIGDLFKEGEDNGSRSSSGVISCQDVSPPLWNQSVYLPCRLTCPEGFLKAGDGEHCFMFSGDSQMKTFVGAAKMCLKNESTLALMTNSIAPFSQFLDSWFLVNHVERSLTDFDNDFPLPSKFTCNSSISQCDITAEEKCTAADPNGYFKRVSCSTPSRYVCQLPPLCPNNYQETSAVCIRIAEDVGSFLESAENCSSDGGGLFYLDEVNSQTIEYLKMNFEPLLPLHLFTGSTSEIQYELNILIVEEDGHRFLPVNMSHTGPTHAICQYPGHLYCEREPSPLPNATLIWNNQSNIGIASASYECDDGFFVGGNTSVVTETMHCLGIGEEWQPRLEGCERVQVCLDAALDVQSSLVMNISDEDIYYLHGNINFICPSGMAFNDLNTTLNATCSQINSASFGFVPSIITPCSVCLDFNISNYANMNYSWVSDEIYEIGSSITLTCFEGYEYSYQKTIQTINCTGIGWNYTIIQPCYQVCLLPPPTAGENMIPYNVTDNRIFANFSLRCIPDHYLIPSQAYPAIVDNSMITCNASGGVWQTDRGDEPLSCTQLCLNDPPPVPKFANSTWNTTSLPAREGNEVSYSCAPGYYFANYNETLNITCNGTHWQPEVSDLLSCRKVCMEPPEVINLAERQNWTEPLAWLNQELVYSCPPQMANKDGNPSMTLLCTDAGWKNDSQEFLCEDACMEPPPEPLLPATSNATIDFREGIIVEYLCEGGFRNPATDVVLYSQCVNHNWSLGDIPECSKFSA